MNYAIGFMLKPTPTPKDVKNIIFTSVSDIIKADSVGDAKAKIKKEYGQELVAIVSIERVRKSKTDRIWVEV